MKKGHKQRTEDDIGLPNVPHRLSGTMRYCPVCGEHPAVNAGGVVWKWLALHLARHLEYVFTEEGWAKLQNHRK